MEIIIKSLGVGFHVLITVLGILTRDSQRNILRKIWYVDHDSFTNDWHDGLDWKCVLNGRSSYKDETIYGNHTNILMIDVDYWCPMNVNANTDQGPETVI